MPDGSTLGSAEGVAVGDADRDGGTVTQIVGVGVRDAVGSGDVVGFGTVLGEGEGEGEGDGDALGDADALGDDDAVGDGDVDALGDGEGPAAPPAAYVELSLSVAVAGVKVTFEVYDARSWEFAKSVHFMVIVAVPVNGNGAPWPFARRFHVSPRGTV